jgi:hypothetical protein
MTACPLGKTNGYDEYFKMMRNKTGNDGSKLTDTEIIDALPAAEVIKDINESPGSINLVMMALQSSDFNVRQAATNAIIRWNDVDLVVERGLNTNEDVVTAFKGKGIDITAFDVSFDKVSLDDATKLTKYVVAGHPLAIKFVDMIMQAALNKNKDTSKLEKTKNPLTGKLYTKKEATTQLTSDDNLSAIMLIDILAKGGMTDLFGTKSPIGQLKNFGQIQSIYDAYYDKVMNIIPENLKTGQNELGKPVIVWTDGLGKQRELNVFDDNGNVYDPFSQTYKSQTPDKEGNKFIQQSIQIDTYKKYELSQEGYTKLVLEIIQQMQNTVTTQESMNAITSLFQQEAAIGGPLWTCIGSGCATSSGSSGGGGGGSGGSDGGSSSSGKTSAKENTLLVDTGAVENVSILANGDAVGISNTAITLNVGDYTIIAQKDGYQSVTFALQLGDYPVTKQVTMVKNPLKINSFLEGIGGRENLTNEHVFYVYCAYKETITSESAWRTLPKNIEPPITVMIERPTRYDIQYLRYLIQGNDTAAKLLVDEGKVTL